MTAASTPAGVGAFCLRGRVGPHLSALVDWVDSKFVELAIKARAHELPCPP